MAEGFIASFMFGNVSKDGELEDDILNKVKRKGFCLLAIYIND